jgi:hypothetical protein
MDPQQTINKREITPHLSSGSLLACAESIFYSLASKQGIFFYSSVTQCMNRTFTACLAHWSCSLWEEPDPFPQEKAGAGKFIRFEGSGSTNSRAVWAKSSLMSPSNKFTLMLTSIYMYISIIMYTHIHTYILQLKMDTR